MHAANGLLQEWNQLSRDSDGDGYYDEAATAIFRSFIKKLLVQVLMDDAGWSGQFFRSTGYPAKGEPTLAGTNIQAGVKAVIESLHGRGRAY